jgi:hypothetical protein
MITSVWMTGAFIIFGLAELPAEAAARGYVRLIAAGLIAAGIVLEVAIAWQLGWPTR